MVSRLSTVLAAVLLMLSAAQAPAVDQTILGKKFKLKAASILRVLAVDTDSSVLGGPSPGGAFLGDRCVRRVSCP